MELAYKQVKVLEQSQVSPPLGSVPQTTLPLTFLDVPWLVRLHPIQRVLFYQFHHPYTHFIQSILPKLKHTLSLTLQHFYPFSGNLTWPLHSTLPRILYTDGDSVPLTVAESSHDFNHLVGNHARNADDFYHLVPQLPPPSNERVPLLALQITVFPNTGICIGFSFNHVVADGRTLNQFIKSWASICRSSSGGDTSSILKSLPSYDRTVVKDPEGLDMVYMKDLEKVLNLSQQSFQHLMNISTVPVVDKVRATFVMGPADFEKLKKWVVAQLETGKQVILPKLHLSKFVLSCAYVWVCLVKARRDRMIKEWEHFIFPVDCTARLDPPLPKTYFGNCLKACYVDIKREDIIGEDGIAIAAEAIGKEIQRINNEGVLRDAHAGLAKFFTVISEGVLSISGSPKFTAYETDFGWGRPKKTEVISMDTGESTGDISLSESKDLEGGLEVGLVLNKLEMDAFASLFANTIKILS